jgi:tetratricopeptide (TPR) repeat protein
MRTGLRATLIACCGLILFFPVLAAAAGSDKNESGEPDQIDQLVRSAAVYENNGYRSQAIALLQAADQLPNTDQPQRNQISLQLAQLYFELGEYPLSINITKQILDQDAPHGIRAEALNILATVQSTLNTPTVASATFVEALVAREKSANKAMTVVILANHLRHELDYRKNTAAKALAQRLIPLAMRLDQQSESIALQISVAELLVRVPNEGTADASLTAQTLLKRAAANAESRGDSRLQSYAVGHQGRHLIDQGEFTEGLNTLNTAIFLANTSRSYESIYLWQWQTARALGMQGTPRRRLKNTKPPS